MLHKAFDFLRNHKFIILLCFFVLTYITLFSYLSIMRFLSFNSHYYDLGIMHQTVYNTSQGRFLEMTNPDNTQNISRLAIHFDPILAFFAPLYKIFSARPEILLISQTIAIALGAIALYLLTLRVLKKKILGLLSVFLYLNYYQLQFANLFDFHAPMFLPAIFIFIFYFIEIKKYKWVFILFLISLLTKENVGLTTFFFGGYLFFVKKEKKFGLIMMTISLFVSFILFFYLIPYFRQGAHFALRYYDFSIQGVFSKLFSITTIDYIYRLIEPAGLLALLSPLQILIALPEFMINLLSSNANMRIFYFHYTALIIPFIFIASVYGLRCVIRFKWIIPIVLILNIYSGVRFGPFSQISYNLNNEKLRTVVIWQKILANDKIKVATTPQIAPFFTAREYYYNFLYDPAFSDMGFTENDIIKGINKYEIADYVLIATSEVSREDRLERLFYIHLKQNNKFKQIYKDQNIEVYKKIVKTD